MNGTSAAGRPATSVVRRAFWAAVGAADELLRHPEVIRRWSDDSALTGMTVGHLAAHLARSVLTVAGYLAAPPASGAPLSPAEYYLTLMGEPADTSSSVNRGVRQRSRDDAEAGPDALLSRWDDAVDVARRRVEAEPPPGRLMVVASGLVVQLEDYLVTWLIELTVHADDLAVSLGLDSVPVPPDVATVVSHALVDIARLRHGDRAVIRAMTRRERETAELLRVF